MKKVFLTLSLFCVLIFPAIANTKIKVLKVYDGDSILAQINDNIFRIRLIGIDCFEGTPNKRAQLQAKNHNLSLEQINQKGNIAREVLTKKIKNKTIEFEFQGIDTYSRALGILYDGKININEEMLKTPYCVMYKKTK